MPYNLADFSGGLAIMRERLLNGTYLDRIVEKTVAWGTERVIGVCSVTVGGLGILVCSCVCLIRSRLVRAT